MEKLERRNFLVRAGQVGLLSGLLGAAATQPVTCNLNTVPNGDAGSQLPALPWPYAKLDVETVRKRGHYWYYTKDCCGGVFTAIVKSLVEAVGAPFDKIPCDMMLYGAGGAAGFGSLCGALNGAGAAIGLAFDKPTTMKLMTELISWYAVEPFPSDISNTYAQNHEFLVEQYKTDAWLPSSVADSELCHASVTHWCLGSGFASGSVERSERCGRLAGDVAAKAVELMNAQYDGTFIAAHPLPSEAASCSLCHYQGTDFARGQFTRGKTNCEKCHVDLYSDLNESPHGFSW
ncbi:MAG: C_GCAxxG_C_C family protein [Candidatus Hydrogenedentes bacterium]|nr:C_GCAxxG_C_C family protein [Candidatus Hydrogenedentota bacterium]